ncbi:hypothetical protein UA74_04510 [Actinoalloteichus fjordicus]|uniref:DUF5753 domain-containing protein n=2 Tax=Actinoalloteichus fjordicus TaxID=1612552 RepID=A0AAC9PQL3_9PSEU|nr:hypothetical protein UA74_04510 [Actinoalloteichus fjordicus]
MSRKENAEVTISPSEVRDLCRIYGADVDRTEWLTDLSRRIRAQGWWVAYSDVLTDAMADYVELECEAAEIRYFEVDVIPGLLQTERYARELFAARDASVPSAALQRRAEMRLRRQDRISSGGVVLSAVIDETAIHRAFHSPAGEQQIDHLLAVSEQSNVTVQLLPLDAGLHAASGAPFTWLGFPQFYQPVVWLDSLAGSLWIEEDSQVCDYDSTHARLTDIALNPSESKRLIRRLMKEAQ